MSYSFLLKGGQANIVTVPVGNANNGQSAVLNRKTSQITSASPILNGKVVFNIPAERVTEFAGSYSITVGGSVVQFGDIDVVLAPVTGGGGNFDPSAYYTKFQTDTNVAVAVSPKADKTYVDGKLVDYAKKVEVAEELINYATDEDLATKVSATDLSPVAGSGSYADLINTPDLNTFAKVDDLSTKANANQVYTKTEADSKYALAAFVVNRSDYEALLTRIAALEGSTGLKAPNAVQNVAATTSGSTAVVSWNAPVDNGVSITQYEISASGIAATRVAGTQTSYTFNNLTPGNTYTFSVSAVANGIVGSAVTLSKLIPVTTTTFGTRRLGHPFWNSKLGTNVELAPTSTDMVSRLNAQFNARTSGTTPLISYNPPYNTDVATGNYSICIYEVPADTPRVKVYSVRDKYYTDADSGSVVHLQSFLEAVPLPNPALMSDNDIAPSGSDGSIIVIDPNTKEWWELWQVKKSADGSAAKNAGYDWQCTQAGYGKDYRYHPGWWSGSGDGNVPRGGDFGVSASGFSYLGCILTGADYYATDITHPLTLALPITGGTPSRLLPATRNDAFNFTPTDNTVANSYRIPEGARFRLDPAKYTDDYINTYAASKGKSAPDGAGSTAAVLAKVLRCLRDYGVIIGDSSQILGWSAEHNKTYGTPYNPYTAVQRPNWGDFGQQIPYGDLLQIKVPEVQFHQQGPGPTTDIESGRYDFSMARPSAATTFTDSFSTLTTVGIPNWTIENTGVSGYKSVRVLSTGASLNTTGTQTVWMHPFERFQPSTGNQRARVTFANVGTGSGLSPHAAVRAKWDLTGTNQNPTFRGYLARYNKNMTGGAGIELVLVTDTASTTLGTYVTATVPAWIEVRAVGTTISVTTSNSTSTPIISVTDTTFDNGLTAAAMRYTASTDTATSVIRTFECGDYSDTALAVTTAPVVTQDATTSTSQGISWTTPDYATSYDVDYKLTSASTWTNAVTGATSTSYVVSGLAVGTSYDYRVRGKNTYGNGPYSTTLTVATSTATPTWSYGLQDNSSAYVRKDVYLPSSVTRVHAGPALSASGAGWNLVSGGGTFAAGGDRYILGDRSMKLVTAGTGATSVMQRAIPTVNLTDKVVRVLMYIDDITKLSSIGFHFASNGSSTMADSGLRTLDPRFFISGWQTITINPGELPTTSGTFNKASWNYMKISVKDAGSSTNSKPVEVQINGIWAENISPIATKGRVALCFDDGYASQVTDVMPLMDSYGMKGTAYVMPGNFGQGSTWMTATQARSLITNGWTVGAHAWNSGNHTGQTGQTLINNIEQTRNWLTTNNGHPDHFAYWDGLDYQNGDVRDIIASRFKYVRANKGAQVSLESAVPGRLVQMRSWLTSSTGVGYTGTYPDGTYEANGAAEWIKRTAIDSKGLAIFTWHNVGSDLPVSTFETFLKFLRDARDAGVLDVVTMQQAMSGQ